VISSNVLALARRQHGVVHRRQLAELRVSAKQIRGARSRGQLIRVFQDVFVVAPSPDTFELRCHAVQLWMNGNGFLSGPSAGRIHGLAQMQPTPIHFTTPAGVARDVPKWVELHRSSWYDPCRDRITTDSGLVVATAERMLFGLADALWQRPFEHAADDAWNLGLISPGSLADYLERHRCRGKNGVARIEAWLERVGPADRPTQSYFERDLIDALDDLGVTPPERQHPLVLRGGEIIHFDIAWPAIRLAIEPGHSRFHVPERDRRRDLACGELGWVVHRLDESMRTDLSTFARSIARIQVRRTLELRAHPASHFGNS
jgi:hypothetical protein